MNRIFFKFEDQELKSYGSDVRCFFARAKLVHLLMNISNAPMVNV